VLLLQKSRISEEHTYPHKNIIKKSWNKVTMRFNLQQALVGAIFATTVLGAAISRGSVRSSDDATQHQIEKRGGKTRFCKDINFGGDCTDFAVENSVCCKWMSRIRNRRRSTSSCLLVLLQITSHQIGTMSVRLPSHRVATNATSGRKSSSWILVDNDGPQITAYMRYS
jgi:hypothetical protein